MQLKHSVNFSQKSASSLSMTHTDFISKENAINWEKDPSQNSLICSKMHPISFSSPTECLCEDSLTLPEITPDISHINTAIFTKKTSPMQYNECVFSEFIETNSPLNSFFLKTTEKS
jgi:hypothetical protein